MFPWFKPDYVRLFAVALIICASLVTAVLVTIFAAPKPKINGLSPSGAMAGGPGFTLTVTGTNFNSNCVVSFGGNERITTFVNATQVTAEILAADIQTAGTFKVMLEIGRAHV